MGRKARKWKRRCRAVTEEVERLQAELFLWRAANEGLMEPPGTRWEESEWFEGDLVWKPCPQEDDCRG